MYSYLRFLCTFLFVSFVLCSTNELTHDEVKTLGNVHEKMEEVHMYHHSPSSIMFIEDLSSSDTVSKYYFTSFVNIISHSPGDKQKVFIIASAASVSLIATAVVAAIVFVMKKRKSQKVEIIENIQTV